MNFWARSLHQFVQPGLYMKRGPKRKPHERMLADSRVAARSVTKARSNGHTLEARPVPPTSCVKYQQLWLEDQATGLAAAVVALNSPLEGQPRRRKDS
jgi:hypothetical protein